MIHRFPVRVYYEDTDLAGVVYYANYLKFLERGRTEALRDLGIDQTRLNEEDGLVFVVTRVEIDYRQPARFDDMLTVTTALKERRGARAVLAQRVERDGAVLVTARVTLACMGLDGRPQRLGPVIGDALDRLTTDG